MKFKILTELFIKNRSKNMFNSENFEILKILTKTMRALKHCIISMFIITVQKGLVLDLLIQDCLLNWSTDPGGYCIQDT